MIFLPLQLLLLATWASRRKRLKSVSIAFSIIISTVIISIIIITTIIIIIIMVTISTVIIIIIIIFIIACALWYITCRIQYIACRRYSMGTCEAPGPTLQYMIQSMYCRFFYIMQTKSYIKQYILYCVCWFMVYQHVVYLMPQILSRYFTTFTKFVDYAIQYILYILYSTTYTLQCIYIYIY